MSTLLALKNLTLTYPHKVIFKDINFTLSEGDKIGVLGLNGHGKSSLFKILAGEATADITVPPFIYDKNRDFSLFLVPQELPQHPGVSLENYFYEFYPEFKQLKQSLDKISEQLGEPDADFDKLIEKQTKIYDKLHELGEDRIYNQYLSYLKLFELKDLQRTLKDLSGGEQRKVALSLGLSAPHQVILWDEPTNHLDLATIELFEDELSGLKKTFMIISHDRALLNNVVERIVHILNGKIVNFKGTYQEYLAFLQEEEKRRAKEIDKLSNYQRRESLWYHRGAKARRTKSKKRMEDFGTLNKTISELKSKAHKQVSLNVQGTGRKTKILLEATDLGLSFGPRTLFSELNFKVAKGDKIALLGDNGVGKSSLLKMFMQELQPTQGKIKIAENLNVGFFSQKRETLKPDLTPWELIGEGIDYVISSTGERRHVAGYLEGFLFKSEELKRPIHTFSGGEKNRLQLAQFMKNPQDIWIFDEPTNDLDLETIGVLEEELKNYEGALFVVGHDRAFIENITNKCWLLHDKKLEMFDGGFPQASLYLEAIELEKKLKALDDKKPKAKNPSKNEAQADDIESKIEKLEAEIAANEEKLQNFDYTNKTQIADSKKIEKVVKEQKEQLNALYEQLS
ncbi:MAG: ABC-F family ATP-binding cassette domain-containing protein [Bacteriovoracaceae bacterium]|nr:ABC-F family ATP-binding cassette domain-containing protein [Bacteriovoracaceae bacterium]